MSSPDPIFDLPGGPVRPADDIISLKQHVPGGKFRYIDIASQQMWEQALRRWPLMAELHALQTVSGEDMEK